MTTIILFIIILSLLVFVHELGHFSVAKWSGMKVDEFGFGFPPKLFGYKWKGGETEYTINAIPLGGFVRIHGESGDDRDNPRSFSSKPIWKRFLVLIAGVTMNVLFAWFLFWIGFMVGMPTVLDDADFDTSDISDSHVGILYVLPDSPAQAAGLKMGDELISVDNVSVLDSKQGREQIGFVDEGSEMVLSIVRDGESSEIVVSPEAIEDDKVAIGIQLATLGTVKYGPIGAVRYSFRATVNTVVVTAVGFKDLIGGLFAGEGAQGAAGPIGIAKITGDYAALGVAHLLYFAAFLSVNLAILNVLPFPALDGGRIFFLMIEAIRRKPVSAEIEGMVHSLGFAVLMILVFVVTYGDIMNLIAK